MLRLFARFIAAMTLFAVIYLLYTNTTQTSFTQFKKKEIIFVSLANLPEIILPAREEKSIILVNLFLFYNSLYYQRIYKNPQLKHWRLCLYMF